MYVTQVVGKAMTGALLLCLSSGIGWAHETDNHQPIQKADQSGLQAPVQVLSGEVTVIERRLGEGTAATLVVRRGETVRLILHAAEGIELHLHGYDLSGIVTGESPVVMNFRADYVGRFPIEAHGVQDLLGRTDRALAYLEVRPE